MYKHILVPTDVSELSKHAVVCAAVLAKAVKARLTVLTISIPYYEFAVEAKLTTVGIEKYEKGAQKRQRIVWIQLRILLPLQVCHARQLI